MPKFNTQKIYDAAIKQVIPSEKIFDVKLQSILKDFQKIAVEKLNKVEARTIDKGIRLDKFNHLECSKLLNRNVFYNKHTNSLTIEISSINKNFKTIKDVFYPILKGSRFGGAIKFLCNNSNKLVFLLPDELTFLNNGRLYFLFSNMGSIETGCYLDFDLKDELIKEFYYASLEIAKKECYGKELIDSKELLLLSNLSYKSEGDKTISGDEVSILQKLELKYTRCLIDFYDNEFDILFNHKFIELYEKNIKILSNFIENNPGKEEFEKFQNFISILLKVIKSNLPKNNFFHSFHSNEIITDFIYYYFKIPFQESLRNALGDKNFEEFDWHFHSLLQFLLIDTKNTNFGKNYPTLNRSSDKKINYISLTQEPISSQKYLFWSSKRNKLMWELNFVHEPQDVPLKLENIFNDFENQTKKLNDIQSIQKVINSLLEEASALQENHIPPGAFVQIEIGIFKGVKVYELGNEIVFKWITDENKFVISYMSPSSLTYSFFIDEIDEFIANKLPGQAQGFGVNENSYNTIFLNIQKYLHSFYLLQASIIRDFWIVENRESVFCVKNLRRKNHNNKKEKTNQIVYLPRRRYINNVNIKKFDTTLNLSKRNTHIVRQHFRKSNPTKSQLHLAKLLGVYVPEGKTLIRQHYRGDGNNQKIYKSMSALFIVANNDGVVTNESSNFPTWFDFENKVKKLYINLGYEIVFKAINYRGDGGVDVRARKRRKNGVEEILIQCKCWKNPVGPDTVRELLGSLVDFADNDVPLKGAIYTTSYFTSGAIEIANKHNIELYDETYVSPKMT